jgi:hypothetical protein
MIIGINGKIGSGKDTVGSIIQYLTDKNVTTETFEFWYASNFYSVYQSVGMFQIKKFAGKLKQIASLLTGIDVEKFEDQEFKKLEMPECWNRLQQSGRSKVWVPMTYRQFLQELGTEAMREGLHTNVWVNALFADYKESPQNVLGNEGYKLEDVYPNWIITDMRFPNEMEAVIEKGGITIRVVRPGTSTGTHPSEIALDGHTMHYEIINDGTIEDLIEKVKEILIKENII